MRSSKINSLFIITLATITLLATGCGQGMKFESSESASAKISEVSADIAELENGTSELVSEEVEEMEDEEIVDAIEEQLEIKKEELEAVCKEQDERAPISLDDECSKELLEKRHAILIKIDWYIIKIRAPTIEAIEFRKFLIDNERAHDKFGFENDEYSPEKYGEKDQEDFFAKEPMQDEIF